MRKLTITIMLVASLFVLAACGSNGSEVVVKSKAGNITKDEFYEELKSNLGEKVLEEMILVKVLESKFEINDEEINAEVDSIKEQLGDQFEATLMQQGIANEETFKKSMRINMLYQKAVHEGVEVSDDEAKERYDRMKTEIDAQHILLESEEEAKDIKAKIDAGEDFDKLAKEFSKDPGSAEDGGKLGFFSAGRMVKEFEDAAYSMDVGTISDPVQTSNGYHIIKVIEKRDLEAELEPFEDMKENIIDELKFSKVDQIQAQEKIDKLIKDANVDIKIKEFKKLFGDQ